MAREDRDDNEGFLQCALSDTEIGVISYGNDNRMEPSIHSPYLINQYILTLFPNMILWKFRV